jgi:hypothetical protein
VSESRQMQTRGVAVLYDRSEIAGWPVNWLSIVGDERYFQYGIRCGPASARFSSL